ncbi:MAG: DUF2341 domain-containing protein [Patescibacteria group bacterium]|jgi:hypothetical protein
MKALKKARVQFLLVLILFIATTLIYVKLQPKKSAEAAWYNDSWQYRQTFTATNGSAYSATNVPYRLIFDTASPIAANKMLASGNDIRIVNSKGAVVRFQVEQSTLNTTQTGIWFEATIPANTSAVYYIYYGNNQASAPSFTSDVSTVSGSGTTVEMKDGSGYTTSTNGGQVSDIRKNGTNLGVNGNAHHTTSYPGNWWDDRPFTQTLLASGPLFVEVKYTDSTYGSYSDFGTNIKMFKNNFAEVRVYMTYNTAGSEQLYYYLNFDNGTRNSVWVNGSEVVVDQAPDSGGLTQASLGDSWFGQRWTGTGVYGGTIIRKNNSDWTSGFTSAQSSYYQTNYSNNSAYTNGSSREIRYGIFAGDGGLSEMTQKGSSYGDQTTTINGSEEKSVAPVAYWKFDEGTGGNAHDSTANKNDGTTGGTWTNEDQCINGKCLYFNGTDVSVPDTNSTLDLTSKMSFSFWWRPMSQHTGYAYQLLSKWSTTTDANLAFYFFGDYNGTLPANKGLMRIYATAGGTWKVISGSYFVTDADLGKWMHVSFNYDTATGGQLYINGSPVGVRTGSGDLTTNNLPFRIGGYIPKAYFDEVKIYGYERTATQIKTDYQLRGSSKSTSVAMGSSKSNNDAFSNGLVGYWKMDENTGTTVADTSGNGGTMTFTGNAPSWVVGKYGSAIRYNGTNSLATVPNSTPLNITGNAITLSAWVYLTAYPASYGVIYQKDGYADGYRMMIASTGQIYSDMKASERSMSSTGTVPLNTWTLVNVTYDGAKMYTYINGASAGSLSVTPGNLTGTTASISFGLTEYPPITGSIDEARVYNRALSASEVSSLYNFAPGPVGYWNFDAKTGATVADLSGNNNVGAFIDSPSWTVGKYGGGLKLDGSNDGIQIAQSNSMKPAKKFTVSAWINIPSYRAAGEYGPIIEGAGNLNSWTGYYLGFDTSANLWFYAGNGTAWTNTSTPQASIPLNSWHYVTGVVDDSTISIYVDGILKSTSAHTLTAISYSADPIRIGRLAYCCTTNHDLTGSVDEVKIYDYARSSKQIIEDMNAGHPAGGSPVGSQALYWKLDEGIDDTAHSSGATTVDGTLTCTGGTCTNPTWTNNGKFGKAVTFSSSGTDRAYITAATVSPVNLPVAVGSKITISTWMNPLATQSGGGWYVRNGTGVDENYALHLSNSPTNGNYPVSMEYYDGTWRSISTTGQHVPQAVWSHVTVVLSQGQWMKVYVNGVFKEQVTWVGSPSVLSTSSFNIGGHAGTTGQYFNGSLDEFKVYGTELTADEIKLDYNRGQTMVLGSASVNSSGVVDNSSAGQYCVPGDATSCLGPVGEWNFEEGSGTTANDSSENDNVGNFTSSPVPSWTIGKIGKSLRYNTGGYLSVTDAAPLQTTAAVTLEAWVNFANITSFMGITGKEKTGTPGALAYGMRMNNVGTVFGDFYISGVRKTFGTFTAAPNTWYHVTVTFDGTNLALYKNGQLSGSVMNAPGTIDSTVGVPLLIGRDGGYGSFTGHIDQVRIFNYARTPAQIAWDYNQGKPAVQWKFDECQGTTANDSSGNGNTGTITIGATVPQSSAGTCTDGLGTSAWNNGATGKYNSSLRFDGVDDYMSKPMTVSASNGTISFWIKDFAIGVGTYLFRSDANVRTYIGANSSTIYFFKGNPAVVVPTTPALTVGSWNHIVLRWWTTGGVQYAEAYANGKSTGAPVTFLDSTVGTYVTVGGFGPTGTQNAAGQFDDIQVFNYALTTQQIKNLYNQNSAIRFGPASGMP